LDGTPGADEARRRRFHGGVPSQALWSNVATSGVAAASGVASRSCGGASRGVGELLGERLLRTAPAGAAANGAKRL